MKMQLTECFSCPLSPNPNIDNGLRLAKEPKREIPDEPHDPEIRPDFPPEQLPDLSPEIPDDPLPEIFPDRNEPEISPSPEF